MRFRRTLILAAVVALHALVLVLLLASREPPRRRPPSVEALVLRMVAARPAAKVELPPPADVTDRVAVQVIAPMITIAADAAPGAPWPGGVCAPLDAIGRALAADPRARAAIAAAPPGVRSDAGAIALWNGTWATTAAASAAPLAPLREMVEHTLATAPVGCLDTAETGPRLVAVPDAARPTLIVLGSGVWHWRDLVPANAKPHV